jgi:ubiquinone/menaquinone biosynthesis C-methylase UbiE
MTAPSALHRAEIWTDAVAGYEALAEPQTRRFARDALDLAGGVRPGEYVLDVATGTGALALEAAADGARVLATDFSPGMVDRVAVRLAEAGFDRTGCEARVMDGPALELTDASVEAAFSIFGVMLFPDWALGLRELHRVVRPGGRVVMATWANPEGAGPAIVFHRAWREAFPGRERQAFPNGLEALSDADRLAAAMTAAGSHDVRVVPVSHDWTLTSADWLADEADRLFRQFPGWTDLEEGDRTLLRERLRAANGEATDEPMIVRSDALIGIGRV